MSKELTAGALPTTNDLYKKHFGESWGVGLLDNRIEAFFEELNQVCLEEDRLALTTTELTLSIK